jgi:hypothetical protein
MTRVRGLVEYPIVIPDIENSRFVALLVLSLPIVGETPVALVHQFAPWLWIRFD